MDYPETGRTDDILRLLARAETRRYAHPIPRKGPLTRNAVEPFFQLFGGAVAAAVSCLPAAWAEVFHDKLFLALLGKGKPHPFDAGSPHIEEARRLLAAGGPGTALLCPASHPPAHGDLTYLTVELMRHALWALRRAAPATARPRIIVAVDDFGLDQLDGYEQAAYGGYMSRRHLGFDRLHHGRGWWRGLFLGPAAWPRLVWRLFGYLRRGTPVGFMLGGGVPATSRVMYTVREFIGRLWRERPGAAAPAAALAALAADEDFRAWRAAAPPAPYQRGVRRLLETWLASCLTEAEALAAVDRGEVPPAADRALRAAARALGWSESSAESMFAELREEFVLATPYRARLFRLLAARCAPAVILPLDWGGVDAVRMRLRPPVLITGCAGGRVRWRGVDGAEHAAPARAFAKTFVLSAYGR